jgi:rubredoxin
LRIHPGSWTKIEPGYYTRAGAGMTDAWDHVIPDCSCRESGSGKSQFEKAKFGFVVDSRLKRAGMTIACIIIIPEFLRVAPTTAPVCMLLFDNRTRVLYNTVRLRKFAFFL